MFSNLMKVRIEYLFLGCFLILAACNQEDYVRGYPQIVSSRITSNTALGISVEAGIGGVDQDKIIDAGFVWGTKEQLSIEKNFITHLGKPASANLSTDIHSQMIAGKTYFMRAFLQTDRIIVYGPPMSFKSLGSEGATIQSVLPSVVSITDIITITGKGFGTDPAQVTVYFQFSTGTESALTIQSIKDTEITVAAPRVVFESGRIALQRNGELPIYSSAITSKKPAVTSISVTDICSPIQISGTNLLLFGSPSAITVNDKYITIPQFTETSFSLPPALHTPKIRIGIRYGNYYTLVADLIDSAPLPTVTNVPATFSPEHSFIVQGTNFPTCGGLQIQANRYDIGLAISDVTTTQFTVTMSGNYCQGFTFNLAYHGVLITTSSTISPPAAFTIDTVSPLSGKPGDHVIITGTGLENATVSMSAGGPYLNLQATRTSTQVDAIIALPENYDVNFIPDGDITLAVSGCNNFEAYLYHVDLLPITLSDVNPKVGNGTEYIKITGTNFLSDPNMRVWVLDHASGGATFERLMEIQSVTDTEIVLYPLSGVSGEFDILMISYGRQITVPQTIQVQP